MLEIKFESLLGLKDEIDSEIEELTNKYELKIKTYQEQVTTFLWLNIILSVDWRITSNKQWNWKKKKGRNARCRRLL